MLAVSTVVLLKEHAKWEELGNSQVIVIEKGYHTTSDMGIDFIREECFIVNGV